MTYKYLNTKLVLNTVSLESTVEAITYKVLFRIKKVMRPPGRPRRRSQHNTKTDL
jgi:hypothetical protein